MPALSKLQIRAKVMSFISEIKTCEEFSPELYDKFISELSETENKECLFDMFLKEFIKLGEDKCNICAFIIKDVVPKDYMAEVALETIKNNAYSDDVKYKIVQLMRIAELPRDLTELPQYFENPQEILDMETQKLLETATFNPESMLDFLDFISAVSASDRQVLVNSLSTDYRGDELANIIYPILYSDFEDEFKLKIIEIAGDSKSSLVIKPFEYLIQTSTDPDIVKACKTGLKKLKLAGANKEKAFEYFKKMISDTIPTDCYTTIPDGAGNQAFLFSRKTLFGKYLLAAVVINDTFGIADTFGFYNISNDEILKLIAKFYKSEGKYSVSPKYAKYRIEKAIDTTISKKRTFPYEFICWAPLFSDIEVSKEEKEKFYGTVEKKYTKDEIFDLLTEEYTFRWYLTPQDEILIEDIIKEIYNAGAEDISIINDIVKGYVKKIFTDNKIDVWKDRLQNVAYLLATDKKYEKSDMFLYITGDNDIFETFKFIILQRSIMNYLVSLTGNLKESFLPVNIFKKRTATETKYEVKNLEKLIILLKDSWIKYE